jgi:hypothetical protein
MDIAHTPRTRPVEALGALFVEFYTWATTITLGAVLIDIMYAKLAPGATVAFSEVADFLLLLNAVTILAALPAVAFSWKARTARYFIIASLLIPILGLFIVLFLRPLLEGSSWGTTIRVLLTASASILAFIGLNQFHHHA